MNNVEDAPPALIQLADLPSPIPDDEGDPVLLSLFDDALDAAFGRQTARNREIVRARMSLPEGGP